MYDGPARVLRPEIEPGRRVLVVSDIHGNLPYFRGVLEKAGFGGDDLLIVDGDFLEKGAESLKTLREVMALCESGRALALMGNCDDWAAIYTETTGRWAGSILSYMRWRGCGLLWDMALELGLDPAAIDDFEAFKRRLAAPFEAEFAFLASLPHALEAGRYIIAHAAVCPGLPLEAHSIGQLVKCDAWYRLGCAFDKWVVVGHYPVVLYGDEIVCADPIVDRARHIINLDGGCVLKDDGQLNCLVIPDVTRDAFSFVSYDPFPAFRVLSDQAASERSAYIRWGDSRVEVLERGPEFSRCRHVRTGYELDILTKPTTSCRCARGTSCAWWRRPRAGTSSSTAASRAGTSVNWRRCDGKAAGLRRALDARLEPRAVFPDGPGQASGQNGRPPHPGEAAVSAGGPRRGGRRSRRDGRLPPQDEAHELYPGLSRAGAAAARGAGVSDRKVRIEEISRSG